MMKAILRFFMGGRIRRMENEKAIQEKILELNRESWMLLGNSVSGLIPTVWQKIDGYHALTKFEYNDGSPLFNPSTGIPLKAFLNIRTGEIKTFVASIFRNQS